MNILSNLGFSFLDNYYVNIYNEVLVDCDYDYNILFINHNYFNPLNHFSHIIKKYNLKIYIIYNNKNLIEKLENEIKDEECSDNIHLNFVNLNNMTSINNKIKFNKIILLHINSLNYLNNTLDLIRRFYNNNFELHFYVSLSSFDKSYSENKNTIRNYIKNNFKYNLGIEFDFNEFLNNEYLKKFFKIKKIKIFKERNYALYGKSNIYKIILNRL